LKFKELFKKVPLTAFINTLLRVGYMIMSLVAIKLTFNVYTSQEFIEFNYVLFLVGISTFIYYPFTIDLWKQSDKNYAMGITLAFILSLFFMLGVWGLFLIKDFQLGFGFIIGTIFYGVAKYFERISYVSRLTNQQYFAAYRLTYVVLALEYAGLLLIYLLNWPVAVRLLLPGIIIIYEGSRFFKKVGGYHVKVACSSIKKYLNRKNIFLIIYMGFLSITIVCDRAIAYSEQGDLAAILLVFSFTTSILTLFNVVIDTFRPKIVSQFNEGKSLCKLWRETFIILVQLYFASLTLGYFIAIKLSLIPNRMFAYWGTFLTVNLIISMCNLFQITRQSEKEIKSINITWGMTLLIKIVLYAVYKTLGMSYLSFIQSLVSVFCITLGMNYYYECKYIRQKHNSVGESA